MPLLQVEVPEVSCHYGKLPAACQANVDLVSLPLASGSGLAWKTCNMKLHMVQCTWHFDIWLSHLLPLLIFVRLLLHSGSFFHMDHVSLNLQQYYTAEDLLEDWIIQHRQSYQNL
ncbi:hypothetical protein PHYBLDRAFT_69630 [Phycomyces blakesleeanus NRRL 1555(-)]|uniref:Uncharacterized protein n=1 Tax=Phycomyces blakesleeanus (strain ATCC 8743b / DSM 1359 / FGSC 10004 / NBRC 33097 / NRRL 1555) TaxID=763407 RepID=A0A167LIJ0_PHYB8|nr:hypothetical protein PHYBLDRAFT_69630 [Phycomyces blakesleeanus NRRL 1555(-)]OAD70539.1 hypothetical protein PHYBLDRAFT_69630 [Phycomyces blakesleeanus NRRL 1555(-)]|eukprot:XP_018288579.1 hypothetical protein PHYBLDRAFT_69630 [Phycomyces blakesleeanus NRRL 1555(-)]